MIRNMAFPVTGIVYWFLPTTEMLPGLCIMIVLYIVNLALSCTKKFKGNFHLSLKRKSYHHTKYIWHVVAISIICTAIGNEIFYW